MIMTVLIGVAIVVISTIVIGIGTFAIKQGLARFQTGRARFKRNKFVLSSTGFLKSRFRINHHTVGNEARATAGSVAKGRLIAVCFQYEELTSDGLGIWLTIENFGDRLCRWFGPKLTAYGNPQYLEVVPRLHESGGHFLIDLYPGEQYTSYYFFPFPVDTNPPKYVICESWDTGIAFSWARGA